jgi:hypothetical protein
MHAFNSEDCFFRPGTKGSLHNPTGKKKSVGLSPVTKEGSKVALLCRTIWKALCNYGVSSLCGCRKAVHRTVGRQFKVVTGEVRTVQSHPGMSQLVPQRRRTDCHIVD